MSAADPLCMPLTFELRPAAPVHQSTSSVWLATLAAWAMTSRGSSMHDLSARLGSGSVLAMIALAAGLTLAPSTRAGAQAWVYPSFQQSHLVNREFTVAVGDGGYDGTSYLFQWREQLATRSQFDFDGGFATGVAKHTVGFAGLLYGYQVTQQRDSQPIEILASTGLTTEFGHGGSYVRIPFAISVGHRWAFANGVAITPFVHPRVSLEFCGRCAAQVRGGTSQAGIGAGFGMGANVELSSRVSIRFDSSINATTIGPQDNAIGLGVAWSPSGLRRQ
jgi:hypothetical protein